MSHLMPELYESMFFHERINRNFSLHVFIHHAPRIESMSPQKVLSLRREKLLELK